MNLTLNGKTKDIKEWASETGLTVSAIFSRKHRGWSDEKTLTEPVFSNETKITKNDCELYINDLSFQQLSHSKYLAGLSPGTVMKPGQHIRRYHSKKFDKFFEEFYKPMKQNEQKH